MQQRGQAMPESSATQSERVQTVGGHLLKRRLQVVDLSREIYQRMPIWHAHQRPFIMENHRREDARRLFGTAPFLARNLLISEHTGTHTDAIYEDDPDGPPLDAPPPDETRLEY